MLYLLLAIAIGIGVTVYLIKKGRIKDSDGDFIPDVVEDKVKQIKEDVKYHLDEVKEDVGEIVKEAVSKPKKSRKPAPKKSGATGARVEKKPTTSGEGASVLRNKK